MTQIRSDLIERLAAVNAATEAAKRKPPAERSPAERALLRHAIVDGRAAAAAPAPETDPTPPAILIGRELTRLQGGLAELRAVSPLRALDREKEIRELRQRFHAETGHHWTDE